MSELQNLNVLFESLSQKSRPADSFWGPIPKTYNQAILSVKNDMSEVTADPSEDQKLTELQKFLRVFHKSMGIYSKKLEENIKLLSKGSIITGQQPIVFGGPGLIGNKIACVLFLIDLAETKGLGLAPIFFVGDYDGLQKELTRVYMPNPISHSPFIIDSGDEIPEDSNIAAHKAKLPSYEWLKDHLNKIEDNLKGFAKKVKGPAKTLFRERWYHAVTLLKTSFLKATTLSEWSTILWGTICNIILDEGLIFIPTSHPVVRRLVVDEYHPFIQQRERYSKAFNQTTKAIVAKGYNPTLPPRHTNYSPFTIECVDDGNRLTTTIETRNDQIFAEGVCPECKKSRSYDISSLKKLQKIAEIIGPRVDSSQAIFQQLLRIKIRVSGPGEIAYFTQVVSALLDIGFEVPSFVKYTRAFYNAPWIENLGKQLVTRNYGSLHQPALFDILRNRMKSIREDDPDGLFEEEKKLDTFITEEYNKLLNGKQSIDTQKYMGWQFGRFDKNKFGQEVSWLWIDLMLQTGLKDYIPTYKRMYHQDSSLGGYSFINSS